MSKLTLGLDLDATITAAPEFFSKLASAVQAAGGLVHIVTALPTRTNTTDQDYEDKKQRLADLGISYDYLYIAPVPVPANKARYCKAVGIDCLIDNRSENVNAVSKVTNAALFKAAK